MMFRCCNVIKFSESKVSDLQCHGLVLTARLADQIADHGRDVLRTWVYLYLCTLDMYFLEKKFESESGMAGPWHNV